MAAVMSKASLGDSLLFEYIQVHSVSFQILINTVSDYGTQTLTGALPSADLTLDRMSKERDSPPAHLFLAGLYLLFKLSCQSNEAGPGGQIQYFRCILRVLAGWLKKKYPVIPGYLQALVLFKPAHLSKINKLHQ